MTSGWLRVGPYRAATALDRFFRLDGGAMCGVVPRPVWAERHPPDDLGRIRLASRCLVLVRGDGRAVVVDAGVGDRWGDREREVYAIDRGPGLLESLAALSVSRSEVSDVVVSHLHFDHAGGLVARASGGGLEPTFPVARVHVQAEQLAWARAPSVRDRASYRLEDIEAVRDAGLLVVHDGPGEILPSISVRISNGHTSGLQVVVVGDAERTVVFPSDLVPTTSHVHLPWVMAYDNRPLVTLEEKRALLEEAVERRYVLVSEHDPDVPAFGVAKDTRGRFVVEPLSPPWP